MNPHTSLEDLVQQAVQGDAEALHGLLAAVKDDIYGLAIRMLWHPADAEDATQEILVRVFTSLSSFEGRSAFRTWVYRIAVRALLNIKRGRVEPERLTFDDFRQDLLDGLQPDVQASSPEQQLLEAEVRIGCTQAMLLCLDRDHRMAYLLGEVFGFSGPEAAEVLEVDPAVHRKRLSRARQRVETFMIETCALVRDDAPCRCAGRIAPAIERERVDPERLLFAEHPVVEVSRQQTEGVVGAIEGMSRSAAVMRGNPDYRAPAAALSRVLPLVSS